MRYAAPGTVRSDDHRPPVASDTAPKPGAATRISSQTRTVVTPVLWTPNLGRATPATHPYVRTFWTPVIGATATADLMRLIQAAKKKTKLRHPLYLHVLTAEGLAAHFGSHVLVRPDIPLIGPRQLKRLPLRIQRLHDLAIDQLETDGIWSGG